MELKFSENHCFVVEQCPKIKIENCNICNCKADVFYMPCKHNILCSECGIVDLKKCPKCSKEIKEIVINYDITGKN